MFIEREVESAKIELALKSDFNLYDLFKLVDVRGVGAITQQDLKEAFTRHLSFNDFNSDDIYMFFRKHDRRNVGKIDFNSFGCAILPFSREYANLVTDRPEYYCRRERDPRRYFSVDTRYEVQALWSVLFKAERQMEVIRMRLKQRPYLNMEEAFSFCTRSRPGVILAGDFRDILAE